MDKNTKIYRASVWYNLLLLVVPIILLVMLLGKNEAIEIGRWIGFGGLSFIAIVIALIPFGLRLEIGENIFKSYFLGFCINELEPSDIHSITYANLFPGGLGFGKGLIVHAKIKGKNKRFTIGEKLYGKEAIQHAKRMLGKNL